MSLTPPTYGGFPVSEVVTLTYKDVISLPATTTSGTYRQYAFRANSVYDPDATGGGHQPMGRDIWAGIYQNYLVMRSLFIATPVLISTAGGVASIFACRCPTPGFTTSVIRDVLEQGRVSEAVIVGNAGQRERHCTVAYEPKSWFGIDASKDNVQLSAPIGSSPTDQCYFVVGHGNAISTVAALEVHITIVYTVLFRQVAEMAFS